MRHNLIALLALVLACSFGCKQGANQKPALSQEEMVPVIYGLMLSEEYATQHGVADSTIKVADFRDEKYDQVFKLYKTDRKDFTTSYKFYLGHPDELKAIYDSVNSRALVMRRELMNPALRNREKVVLPVKKLKDSINVQ